MRVGFEPLSSIGVAVLLIFFCLFPADVFAAKRVALVIANSSYKNAPKLVTPPSDLSSYQTISGKSDLTSVLMQTWTPNNFSKILQNFAASLDHETVALFYYAGHGIQYKDENFLVGVGARLASESSLESETFPLSTIISLLEKRAGTTLLFWDACRNNPLASKLIGSVSGASPPTRAGAAPIAPRDGNMFVAFSAAPGKEAIDGTGKNSPFAEALARRIAFPNVDVGKMLEQVAEDVSERTGHRQAPEVVLRLSRNFYFKAEGSTEQAYEEEIRKLLAQLQELEQRPVPPPVRIQDYAPKYHWATSI